MNKKAILIVITTSLAVCFLNIPLVQAEWPYLEVISTSVEDDNPVYQADDLGDYDIGVRILGELERTVPFGLIPEVAVTFDLSLWNSEETENSEDVLLQLVVPNGDHLTIDEEYVTLEGNQKITTSYSEFVPENDPYGRYTTKLFIDGRLADFFQFNMHNPDRDVVRWFKENDPCGFLETDTYKDVAVRFCLYGGWAQKAFVDEIHCRTINFGSEFWDDCGTQGSDHRVGLALYDNNGPGGTPGDIVRYENGEPVAAIVVVDYNGEAHFRIDPPVSPGLAFYIGYRQLKDSPDCRCLGVDEDFNHPDQHFYRDPEHFDQWSQFEPGSLDGDLQIWIDVHFEER
jgi:hypothetical protein